VSLNRWVFKWRFNVETLWHNLMSAGKEFQMDGAATSEKAHRASTVCVRGTTSSRMNGLFSIAALAGLYKIMKK